MWLWGLTGTKSAGKTGDSVKGWCCNSNLKAICWQSSLFLRGPQSLPFKVFNWLGEAHPHYRGSSSFLRVYCIKCYSHLKNIFTATPTLMFDQTLALPNWCIKVTIAAAIFSGELRFITIESLQNLAPLHNIPLCSCECFLPWILYATLICHSCYILNFSFQK